MKDPTKYQTRVTRLHVLPAGEPLFAESATVVEIEDEAAGEYVTVRQQYSDAGTEGNQRIAVNDRDEWEAIKAAVERMLAECRPEDRAR
jgi:uncharacterized protein YrzB (UPF0473 family)